MDEANRYRLSPEQHERIFREDIVPELTAHLRGAERPAAVVLGGQPGAGKSAMQSAAEKEFKGRGGALAIVGDDLRAYHPEYRALLQQNDKTAAYYTDRDSGQWVEKLIAYAKDQRFNLVIEGTMRVPEKVAATLTDLRGAGYAVEARAIAVNERLSTLGIHQRYEKMVADRGHGRFTVPAAHEAAYRAMPSTLEMIERERQADRVAVYARGGVQLYENTLQDGQWSRAPGAREAVDAERARPWSSAERQDYAAGWNRVVEQMTARSAPAAELDHARGLRAAAYLETDAPALHRTAAQEHVALVARARTEDERAGLEGAMRDGVQRSPDYRLELVRQDRAAAERAGVTVREALANESYRGRLAEGAAGAVLQARDDRPSEVVVHDRQRIANDVSRLHGKEAEIRYVGDIGIAQEWARSAERHQVRELARNEHGAERER
ncbi:zeta toxin family protein [Denitromonas sp.]|uniref:zeta toxin family protein n=1 Tax=Denitromonas sp. TaxID=2734609 RepID=UPI002AFEBEAA|nr:zeta toxin family protein [Denitromonas sp.]